MRSASVRAKARPMPSPPSTQPSTRNSNVSATWRELHGVVDQLVDDDLQALAVEARPRHLGRAAEAQFAQAFGDTGQPLVDTRLE